MNLISRYLYLAFGWLSFSLGFIGVFVPLLPTTPFMLVAAYCFSKSSKRLYTWLVTRDYIGPMILDWERHRVIRLRAKVLATTLLTLMLSYPIFFKDIPFIFKAIMAGVGMSVLAYIWSCPSVKGQLAGEATQAGLRKKAA